MTKVIKAEQQFIPVVSSDPLDWRNRGAWRARTNGGWQVIHAADGFEAVTSRTVNGYTVYTPRCQSALRDGSQCSGAGVALEAEAVYRCGRHA